MSDEVKTEETKTEDTKATEKTGDGIFDKQKETDADGTTSDKETKTEEAETKAEGEDGKDAEGKDTQGKTLLGTKDPDAEEEKETEKKADEDKTKDASKEKDFELEMPENTPLGKNAAEEVKTFAKENNLSAKQAQALLNQRHDTVIGYIESQKQELNNQSEKWLDEIKANKEIGGDAVKENAELGRRVIARFAPEGFGQLLDQTKLGNHPGFFTMLTRIGKAMGEDTLVRGNAGGKAEPKSTAELLYGTP